MHPSLELSNLSRLPPFLKRRATAAASGSAEEVLALATGLADIAPSNLLLLLPVFYALLDAAQIPGIFNHLDSSSTRIQDDIRVRIAQILFHLRAIARIATRVTIPLAAFMDLWNHIGPWIEFLDEYRDHLPGLDVLSPVTRYSMFLSLVRFMRRDERVSHLINTSVALCVVVGRAWHHLIHANETDLENVSHFLTSLFQASPQDVPALEGLVAGAGGTCVDLAFLVISHLNRVVPTPDSIITEQHALLFCGVELLVVGANRPEDAGTVWGTAFRDALLSHGIIPTLMTASRVLSQPTRKPHIAERRLEGFLTHAIDFMCSFPCSKWIRVALRAGLLPAIFACGTAHHIEETRSLLVILLQNILPASMVYHSVLSQLRVSLVEVRDQDAAATFADAEILELWTGFRETLQSRLEILDGYNTRSLPATMVCDNLECAKICHKHELRRCGGCTAAYYCSRRCQSTDWCGEHRQMCAALSSRRHQRSHIDTRDKSFLRAILLCDYATRREEIALQYLLFMQENPSGMPYIHFDYTEGSCAISLGRLEELDFEEFEYDAGRAVASAGRTQLHLMGVMEGQYAFRAWDFTMPSMSGEFFRELRAMADTLPKRITAEALETYRSRVRDLISSTEQATTWN